ncbi:MAG TPA: CpXC domain-containing protein [Ktedonobacteraceae bacterium]|nr:CpXC domain-containing protein [Ktedonobacteraceae bacterium]
MSRSTTYNINCPCGESFSAQVYDYVNVAKDPQLQYTVLAGLLNVATCPICGRRSAVSRPFIYSDPAHHLLAYVHPRNDAPEEARMLILEKLRDAYTNIVSGLEQDEDGQQENGNGAKDAQENTQVIASNSETPEMPPLQVVFGLDQLSELINAVLSQDERLGKLALNTRSREEAERGQLLLIARKLAQEMQCQIEVEDLPDEYTVWVYGSRRQIGALMRELAART